MDVSVIIVNYNTLQQTADCIESVFSLTRDIDFEVLLIDNASVDGSRVFFEKDERIRYFYQESNLGFGKANNVGIKEAKGKYLFFLNSDTLLLNNAIQIMADYLDRNPKVGACGGNLYTKDLQPNESFLRYRPSIYAELNLLLRNLPDKILYGRNLSFNHTDKVLRVGHVTGADLMVRRSVLDETGPFDPRFFMYYEETELCHRISKKGYRICVLPQARIVHLNGASFKKDEEALLKRERIKHQSKELYFSLTHSPAYTATARFIRRLTISSKILLSSKNSLVRKRWERIRMIEYDLSH